ncbi:SDR family NAD(P)-dependent oxidoreductase [Mycobacterium sp. OTB74]|uniref:SDR family NAD(P)-dependent oxidoreductase n=1 Tax=Mycobacterium sp. OTB74 TaxID=1853452 RepID=UPI002474BE8F|nr:SDR family NAD(P)-dependent oxidoreductase [Mycobacterium sp. OTB74]MDH6242761.1 NAD(P)-dependent dehydrogenase (short-subunit alcohol dehydrogenase family) [Mycobacterium sp. OTB74]
MTDLRFDDRVAVVTGAGRGIGRCHAMLLAAKGARVVVADYGADIDGAGASRGPADDVVAEILAAGGEALACYGSVAEEASAAGIVEAAMDSYGRLDVVVNNAGIHDPGLFTELTVDQYRAMLDVHFFGTLYMCRAAWPQFARAGYGRVVNTVSEAMLGGIAELSSYGSAKGAVLGLTRNLATEGPALGIRVNAVAPRAYTRMSASHSEKLSEQMTIPADVMEQINASMPPEMCAPAAAYLAHESCAVNGEILRTGMGSVARIALVQSQGLVKESLTAEDIADNIGMVMDLNHSFPVELPG